MLNLNNISKSYKTIDSAVDALSNITLAASGGDFISISGPSGCGKSTLLNIISGLSTPTSGSIVYNGINLCDCPRNKIQLYRKEHVGIVLQNCALINNRTVEQNLALPLQIRKKSASLQRSLIREYLDLIGLSEKTKCFPHELSGGQRQRVSVARALIYNPDIILADEPTASLDKENAAHIISLLKKASESGKIVIMATHDPYAITQSNYCIHLFEGCII